MPIVLFGLNHVVRRIPIEVIIAALAGCPGVQTVVGLRARLFDLGLGDRWTDGAGNSFGNLVLNGKNIGQLSVLFFSPQMIAGHTID